MSLFEHEKLFGQVIKGKITEINHLLLYFRIDNKFRIYVDLTNTLPEVPCKNSDVEIINPMKFNRKTGTILIGPKTTCKFPSVVTVDDTETLELFHILKKYNADVDELLAMDYILRQLEPSLPQTSLSKCLITLIHNAPLVMKGVQGSALRYKRSLKKSLTKLPSDLNYVNDTSELYSFMKFDEMCLYNVYPNQGLHNITDSCAEYLFGILNVDPMLGNFTLSDKTSQIPVKFSMTSHNLYIFNNSLVMFKKWTVFTEIFQPKSASSLKYILVNFEDVVIIGSKGNSNEHQLIYQNNELLETGQRKRAFLQIVKKSEIIFGYNKEPEIWIEALFSEKNHGFNSPQLVYVVLTNSHIAIVPFLKENVVYQIFFIKELITLKIDYYKEIYRIRKSKDLYKISDDTIFKETDLPPLPQNNLLLENFEDVKKFMESANQNQMFTFTLKISKKGLHDNSNFYSWFPKRHENVVNFGAPGKNTQMRLVFHNTTSSSYIDLYMTDRDNHVIPLGLIENMKVRIKHVQVYKTKYIKTNVFSSFEILEYCPEIMFSSVNLSFSNKATWRWRDKTPKTPLGMFSCLPQKCIVHGTFLFQAISFLKITPVCDTCKRPSIPELSCHICKNSGRDLNIEMSICVQDSINSKFFMNTENQYFFFELIGLTDSTEKKHFCDAFLNIGVVKVNFCNLEEFRICIKDSASKMFVDELVKMIRSQINFNLYPMVDAVCMKQRGAEYKHWKLVEYMFM